jgi:hypothetical protein
MPTYKVRIAGHIHNIIELSADSLEDALISLLKDYSHNQQWMHSLNRGDSFRIDGLDEQFACWLTKDKAIRFIVEKEWKRKQPVFDDPDFKAFIKYQPPFRFDAASSLILDAKDQVIAPFTGELVIRQAIWDLMDVGYNAKMESHEFFPRLVDIMTEFWNLHIEPNRPSELLQLIMNEEAIKEAIVNKYAFPVGDTED